MNNSNVADTVWNDVATGISFDFGDLEATFTLDNATTTASQISMASTKQNVTTLLDITRANNIGVWLIIRSINIHPDHLLAIMLSRIKMNYAEIRKALLSVDDTVLSVDDLKAISKQLPTPEEVRDIILLSLHLFI